ncbi:MAG: response regulator [Bacteroidota bacterium]
MNLLLLEDIKSHASLFEYAMEDLGWKNKISIHWAKTKDEAVGMLEGEIDMMFVDYTLGNHSRETGADFCKIARQHRPDCAIIVLSSSEDPRIIEEVYQSGANAFVHKFEDFDDALDKLNAIFTYYTTYQSLQNA